MIGIRKSALLFLLTSSFVTAAQATVYKCLDGEGRITYTNDRNEARNCQPLSRDLPVSTVPASTIQPAATAPAPSSSAGFPSVSPSAQQSRDESRRALLAEELSAEEQALTEAQEELREEEARFPPEERNVGGSINGAKRNARLEPFRNAVELHTHNVEALKQEISRLR